MNIIGNAIKYTQKGSIIVKIAQKNEKIQLKIIDSGKGLDNQIKNDLFTLNSRIFKLQNGMGLGITISNMLVKELGNGEKIQF